MTDFNLRQMIRTYAKDYEFSDSATLGQTVESIVDDLVRFVPQDRLREALHEALPLLVREVLTENRPRGGGNSTSRIPLPTFRPPAPQPTGLPTKPTGRFVGTRTGDQIRAAWQRALSAPYPVASGVKLLKDCNWADLQFISAQREKQAEDLRASARRFNALRGLLTEHSVETVGELPAEVLIQVFG